jgi:hypothetical protein
MRHGCDAHTPHRMRSYWLTRKDTRASPPKGGGMTAPRAGADRSADARMCLSVDNEVITSLNSAARPIGVPRISRTV